MNPKNFIDIAGAFCQKERIYYKDLYALLFIPGSPPLYRGLYNNALVKLHDRSSRPRICRHGGIPPFAFRSRRIRAACPEGNRNIPGGRTPKAFSICLVFRLTSALGGSSPMQQERFLF